MTAPLIRRLIAKDWLSKSGSVPNIAIIPGDRREAMRHALDCFEAGIRVWHLGALDACEGDNDHYDGTYRRFISEIAMRSGGQRLVLWKGESQVDRTIHVGPTMIDDLPNTDWVAQNHWCVPLYYKGIETVETQNTKAEVKTNKEKAVMALQ